MENGDEVGPPPHQRGQPPRHHRRRPRDQHPLGRPLPRRRYVAVAAGLGLLWRAAREPHPNWSTRLLVGLLLMGWGTFNLVEGTVNHHILTLHHVREVSSNRAAWDIAFLVWGAAMLAGGWLLARAGERRSPDDRGPT